MNDNYIMSQNKNEKNKNISIRSPGPVVPKDVHCEGFDLTYTRIANDEIIMSSSTSRATTSTNSAVTVLETTTKNFMDKKVDDSIEIFLRSLTQIGPELLNVSHFSLSLFLSSLPPPKKEI